MYIDGVSYAEDVPAALVKRGGKASEGVACGECKLEARSDQGAEGR